jgi:hypothetical protein
LEGVLEPFGGQELQLGAEFYRSADGPRQLGKQIVEPFRDGVPRGIRVALSRSFPCRPVQNYCGPPERVMNARAAMMDGCVFAVLPSLPGLTRQSIILRTNLAKMDGCAGQARA